MPQHLKAEVISNLKAGEIVSLVQLYNKLAESLMILDKFKLLEDKSFESYETRKQITGVLVSIASSVLVWFVLKKINKGK